MDPTTWRRLLVLVLSGLTACASSPASTLHLRQVVLYRSGMGYFEHSGHVPDSHVRLRLREGEVDDVMKTIAVLSKDQGAVVGAVAALQPRGGDGAVDLDFSVASNREISLSYAVPTPTWRSTHKLVLGDADTGLLQTWAIVDNATDQDWRDVRLTLATGAPLSFAVDLHTARFVDRPDATGAMVRPTATGVVAPERGRPNDADGDGIRDDHDLCPREREDDDGFEDRDGCPDPDNDKDRILDAADKCPNEPETYNGFEDDDGCPDKGRVIVRKGKMEILDAIRFEHGKSLVKPIWSPLLDAIAATLKGNPQLRLVEVAGHAASNEADADGLSAARAEAVRGALLQRGVSGGILVKHSYANTKPICREKNEDCWGRNRRVEFTILRRADETSGRGEETASGEGGPGRPVEATADTVERALAPAPTRATEVAGMVRYDIQTPVTIPARASAMVAVQNRKITSAEVYLYRPDANAPGTDRSPFRAARFECPAGQELEAGPLAIYARGAYVGDAVLERLHPGEVSYVPFGVDGATSVEVSGQDSLEPARIVKIERGVLTVEDRRVHETTYAVAASPTAPARIYVRHDARAGYRVRHLPTGSTESAGGYLVPFTLRAGAKTALVLEEEQPARHPLKPMEGQAENLDAYIKGSPRLPAPVADSLRRAASLGTALGRSDLEARQLRDRIDDGTRRMADIRDNLVSIEKNAFAHKLRADLTGRLTELTRANEQLERKLAQLNADGDEKRSQLRALLEDLDLPEQAP
jgi:outer membrane protein OmpA-like peptidoglycan-associated protein